MKMLIIGNANGLGGAQTAFRKLVEFALNENDVEAGVISINDKPDWPVHWNCIATRWRLPFTSDSFAAKIGKSTRLLQIAVAARRFAPDVFVTVGLAQSANLIARFLPQATFKFGQDFIHGRAADEPLLAASATAFDAIAVQAPSMVEALRQSGFDGCPVTWLPCFPEPPAPGVSHEQRRNLQSLRFAYFGRLAANKGLGMLVKALQRASFSMPVELDIWGSGSEEGLIRQKITSLGMGERVKLRGRYPDGVAAAQLICGYDALLLTSTGAEGLPLILLEAMAYGLPFLATDVGAIRDCCMENSDVLLVQPDDDAIMRGLSELARRILALEIRPDRLRAYYQKHFSPTVMAERWRAFLQKPDSFFA
jgi:glycosyltransferase involved in cell wall biosynthesis